VGLGIKSNKKNNMKKLKGIIAALMITVCGISVSFSQNDTTVVIKTSARCGQCKEKIENALSFEKGIRKVVFDVDKKVITVQYNTKKTDIQKVKTAITKVGYDADEMPADTKAYSKLNKCCQKE
jgi:mercuric ion binding protein